MNHDTYDYSAGAEIMNQQWTIEYETVKESSGFINKDGNFTVNIALVENGMPIFGIIEAPASGKVWFGSFFERPGRRYRLGALFAFLGPLSIIPWILQSRNYGPYSQTKEMIEAIKIFKK